MSAPTQDKRDRRRTPLLILDLDDTVRKGVATTGAYVNEPKDVEVFDEAVTMIDRWRRSGGRVIGVSNQGGIALGYTTQKKVSACMGETNRQVGNRFDDIRWCSHHPDADVPTGWLTDTCYCRKPYPGMVFDAMTELMSEYNEVYPFSEAVVVGDLPDDRNLAACLNIRFLWAHQWRHLASRERDPLRMDPLGLLTDNQYVMLRYGNGRDEWQKVRQQLAREVDQSAS